MTPELLISIVALLLLIVSGWLIIFAIRWRRHQHWLQQEIKEQEFLQHITEICGGHPLKLQPLKPRDVTVVDQINKELKEKANAQ